MTPSDPSGRPTGLRISVDHDEHEFRIGLAGDIDLATVGHLRDASADAVGSGCPGVVLDLGACDFIDSTGVSAVVALLHDTTSAGQALEIRPGGRAVMRVFGVVGLLDELPFTPAPS